MTQTLDREYINQISSRLENFRWKSSNLANNKCPLCGDSAKNKRKARGYFVAKSDKFIYTCHNCGYNASFRNFLKDFDPTIFGQYVIDSLKESGKYIERPKKSVQQSFEQVYGTKSGLTYIAQLDYNHPARTYLRNRQIPTNDVYFVEYFFQWGKTLFPDKFKGLAKEECRIVFPAFDENRNIIGYSCRSINGEEPKYYTLKFVPDMVFGLNKLDKSKIVYVLEGYLDSLFVPNSIAVNSSALHRINILPECEKVLIYDNQNRNKEICTLIQKSINMGHSVVIWPNTIEQKDVNEMVVEGGYSKELIMKIIVENTFKGIEADIRFKQWRKI